MSNNKKILVTGDVVVDRHIYHGYCQNPYEIKKKPGSFFREELGGACLLKQFIKEFTKDKPSFGLSGLDNKCETLRQIPDKYCSYVLWEPFESDSDPKTSEEPEKVWRISSLLGYGSSAKKETFPFQPSNELKKQADIVVLDDADLEFRNQKKLWPSFLKNSAEAIPQALILKMCHKVCEGDLWQTILKHNDLKKKTILVTSVEDIRRGNRRIAREQSWEKAVQDLLRELYSRKSLNSIEEIGHLIVTFRFEGALWIDFKKNKGTFIFDPGHLEGQWEAQYSGRGLGLQSCFTTMLVESMSKQDLQDELDLKEGMELGLAAMREHFRLGHGHGDSNPKGVQFEKIEKEISKQSSDRFGKCNFNIAEAINNKKDRPWTLMDIGLSQQTGYPHYEPAMKILKQGLSSIKNIPYAQFGNMLTIDRGDIQSLNGIKGLIENYRKKGDGKSPLCIAVFGQPGSGKSFGIKQLAKGIWQESHHEYLLEFNLSQFSYEEQLIGAFHLIRDRALKGLVPLVFWDEFDSMDLKWLSHFLAPMQDGCFLEGQTMHPVGKSVFVFAGGTSYTMEAFIPETGNTERYKKFIASKGPDFVSRLQGYIDVLGPNKRKKLKCANSQEPEWEDDDSDLYFPIRRALLLRAIDGVSPDEKLDADEGLLRAFIEIDEFKHGARSVATLWTLMKNRGQAKIRRSDLPPREQMSLHVNYEDFMKLIENNE